MLSILLFFGLSINVSAQNINLSNESDSSRLSNWTVYKEIFPSDDNFQGFTLTFFYPKSIVLLDIVDNCRCVGRRITNKKLKEEPIWRDTNIPYWTVCMNDTAYSIEKNIKNLKSNYKFVVNETRKSIIIDNEKAECITLTKTNNEFLIQNIYFRKFGTIFEIINEKGLDSNYEYFLQNIKIEKYKNYSR